MHCIGTVLDIETNKLAVLGTSWGPIRQESSSMNSQTSTMQSFINVLVQVIIQSHT